MFVFDSLRILQNYLIHNQMNQTKTATFFKIATILFFLNFMFSLSQSKSQRIIKIKNMKFYDEQDREIIFHGTNVVVKVPPYMPPVTDKYDVLWSFSQQDVDILKDRGFNSMRLNVAWAGVQPKKDFYNQTYLDEMKKIVNMAGKSGFYTLIQFHQDIFSEKFCGNGVPIWLVDFVNGYTNFPQPTDKRIPLNASGLPDWSNCSYTSNFKYLFSFDVNRMYKNLYNPNHYMNKKLIQYWQKVAQAFKGNPYVIGYQLMNQPFVASIWENPTLLLPSVAQRLKFQSFYDRLSLKIRQIDPDTPICFQPINWDERVAIGFSHPPGGFKYQNSSILCHHLYIPPCINQNCIDYRVRDARKMGIAGLMSQFATPKSQQSRNSIFNKTQFFHLSWMYWQYKGYGKDFANPHGYISNYSLSINYDHYTFPYFQRISGELIMSFFNRTTNRFTGIYNAVPQGVTVLYLSNEINYPKGYAITVIPEKSLEITKIDKKGNYLNLKYLGTQKTKKIMLILEKIDTQYDK